MYSMEILENPDSGKSWIKLMVYVVFGGIYIAYIHG